MNGEEIELARQKEDAEIATLVGRLTQLGLIDLPNDISNERFVRRIIEGQLEIVARDARLMHEDKVQSDLDGRLLMFQTHAADKATAYNNAVLTLGYAGFFTIWTLLKENLDRSDSLLVGSLLGFSLFVFVVWTVLNALLLSKAVSATASVFSSNYDSNEELLERFRRQENQNARLAMSLQRRWIFVFSMSVIPGLLAGAILFILLFSVTLGFDFSLTDFFKNVIQQVKIDFTK